MCYPQTQDYTNPGVMATAIAQRERPAYYGNVDKVPIYRPGDGGYVRGLTTDAMDPGTAPEGYFSQYRFNPDGQIVGSTDGKTYNPIEGLQLNMEQIGQVYKPSGRDRYDTSNGEGGLLGVMQRQAEALYYKQNDTAENAQKLFSDGGLIKDFRVDADGRLYARVNSGPGQAFNAPTSTRTDFGINGQQQAPAQAISFEGYVPIDNFPLTEMEGNFGEGGRSAFFSPDGAIALNAGRNEEFPGLLTAYTRKRIQELKQADDVNLLTGTRGGG